jgi:hypothetical protein
VFADDGLPLLRCGEHVRERVGGTASGDGARRELGLISCQADALNGGDVGHDFRERG